MRKIRRGIEERENAESTAGTLEAMTFSECQSNRRRQDLLLLWSQIEHRLICIAESRERYDEQDGVEEEVEVEEEVASIAGTISSSGAQAQRRWQEIRGRVRVAPPSVNASMPCPHDALRGRAHNRRRVRANSRISCASVCVCVSVFSLPVASLNPLVHPIR